MFRFVPFGAVLLASTAFLTAQAGAQTEPSLRELFNQVLANPTNVELTLRYADAAVAAGDYEGAIATLERVLILSPDLPNVQLQLGLLYNRIGSYAAARRYLQQARENPRLPARSRPTVERALAEADHHLARNAVAFTATSGVRYQTNANAAPSSNSVRNALAAGGTSTLSDISSRKSDFDFFAAGVLVHSYDLETQDSKTLETKLTAYASEHLQHSDLSAEAIGVSPGLRFEPAPGAAPGLSIRPHVLGEVVRLDQELYNTGVGGGVDARYVVSPRIMLDGNVDAEWRDFHASNRQIDANDRDGWYVYSAVTATIALAEQQAIQLGLTLDRADADKGRVAYVEGGALAAYTFSYASPVDIAPYPWRLTISGGIAHAGYDAADPAIDPAVTREDTTARIGLGNAFGITENLSLLVEAEYRRVFSNLSNYSYVDTSVVGGIRVSF